MFRDRTAVGKLCCGESGEERRRERGEEAVNA